MDEDFSRQTRRFSAAILTYGKGKRRRMAGKRPLRRRSTVVNTGSNTRLHEKVDEVSPQGGCDIRKALKRQRLSNAFYSAEGALKSYETAFVPVAQMGGALSNAFFRRKYLFSAEESYQF